MVLTSEIPPHPALHDLVRCYGYRTFDTLGCEMLKPIHAMHEFFMTFWLDGGSTPLVYLSEDCNINGRDGGNIQVLGLQTKYRGMISFNGNHRLFSIQFRPAGFFRVFGIPLELCTHQMLSSEDLLGSEAKNLICQLNEAPNLTEMVERTDRFLLYYLRKSKAKDPYNAITQISNALSKNHMYADIKTLAREANLSVKSFERQFGQKVGIGPKLYCRINRFNQALLYKMLNPDKSWTHITHTLGYYDQNHFIKDFKEFANNSPGQFMKYSPPPIEQFTNIVE